jgi:hypothetical protein
LPLLYYCLPIFFFINHSHECSQQLGWVKYGVGKGDTLRILSMRIQKKVLVVSFRITILMRFNFSK